MNISRQSSKKESVALSSVFASLGLTLIKVIVGVLTGSMGIISEAAHSALDFGAALLTYFAVKVGDKPADKNHPYGHGKIESVSALIETGLLFLTSVFIIYEAIKRLIFHQVEIEVTWYSFVVIMIAILVDFSRSRALKKVADETRSHALEADALHFSSDILSSIVVLCGLVFVLIGVEWADAIAAIGVSLFVGYAGYQLGRRTIDVLIDTAPEGLAGKIVDLSQQVDGVISVENIRVRSVGSYFVVDMTVNVSRKLSLEKVHQITENVEKNIKNFMLEADVTVKTKPVTLSNESMIERVHIIALNNGLEVHDIAYYSQKKKKYLSFDLEVDGKLKNKEAHAIADQLEREIKNELGDDLEITTHIEPFKAEAINGKLVNGLAYLDKEKIILKVAKKMPLMKNVHDIRILKNNNKLFISLHCLFDNLPLEAVHNEASHFEYLIKEQMSNVERVVVHSEPFPLVPKFDRQE